MLWKKAKVKVASTCQIILATAQVQAALVTLILICSLMTDEEDNMIILGLPAIMPDQAAFLPAEIQEEEFLGDIG